MYYNKYILKNRYYKYIILFSKMKNIIIYKIAYFIRTIIIVLNYIVY